MHDPALITRLIHENLSIITMFAFGQPPAREALQRHFKGEWKYLSKMIYQVGEERADRALLEMATQLRILNKSEDVATGIQTIFGKVIQADGKETPMYYKDMTNKVIHASKFRWNFKIKTQPKIITESDDPARWQQAEIEVLALMHLGGQIMF
jgi:hypothetical protein